MLPVKCIRMFLGHLFRWTIRSTSSSRSGRLSRPFFRLFETFSRSNANCAAWRELDKESACVLALGDDEDERGSVGVEKNVAVLQVLSIRAMLQMLLEGVSALDWRNRCFIDLGRPLVFLSHSDSIHFSYPIARED
jgi:hypothetical protein